MKKKSHFTRRESQLATATEVLIFVGLGLLAGLTGYSITGIVLFIWACVSMILHANRNYKDTPS